MVNEYEQFQKLYTMFSLYSEGFQDAYSGRKSQKLKDLAATTTEDENFKTYITQDRRVSAEELCAIFRGQLEQIKPNIDVLASSKLENIVNNMPEPDIKLGVMITPAKNKYSGANADVYTDISKLKKDYLESMELVQSKDTDKMAKYVSDFYKAKYSAPEKAEQLKPIETLISVGGGFVEYMCEKHYMEKQKAYAEKLKGNEKGYLTANLKDTNFLKFYDSLQETKENIERQAEREKGRIQNPKGNRHYRRAAA